MHGTTVDSNQRKKRSSNEIFNGIRILNKRATHESNDKLLESVVVQQRTAVTSIGGSRLSQNKQRLDRKASNGMQHAKEKDPHHQQVLTNSVASGQLRLATSNK
jgi:hypothetical protein